MTGSAAVGSAATDGKSTERACRCETVIPAAILEGYACGAADCWRTTEVAASFAAFVDDLKRKRETTLEPASGLAD